MKQENFLTKEELKGDIIMCLEHFNKHYYELYQEFGTQYVYTASYRYSKKCLEEYGRDDALEKIGDFMDIDIARKQNDVFLVNVLYSLLAVDFMEDTRSIRDFLRKNRQKKATVELNQELINLIKVC